MSQTLLTVLMLLGCAPIAVAQTTAPPAATPSISRRSATHPHHRRRHTAAAKPAPCPPALPAPVVPANIPPAAGAVETAFALRYVDLQPGTGAPVEQGQFVTVNYTGWLASDGTEFDSSAKEGGPITFLLGAHRVIPGWDQGFAGMQVGGKRRLFIPYQLAYGAMGREPVIPPKSDLIFDIEVVSASANPPGTPPAVPPPPTPPPTTQPAAPPTTTTPSRPAAPPHSGI